MDNVTSAELIRRVESIERRQADAETRYVLNAVYVRDHNELRNDISEIKESQKWAMRLIAAQFVALLIALLMFVIQRLPA